MITSLDLERIADEIGKIAMSRRPAPISLQRGGDAYTAEKAATSPMDSVLEDEVVSRLPSEITILSEERHESEALLQGAYTAIIDSLDGTRNYLTGSHYWGISIALAHGCDLVVGAISYPGLGITLRTARGEGTFVNGERILLVPDRQYSKADIVRVSGALPGKERLRALFPKDADAPGSLIVTLLALLNGNGATIPGVPAYAAYIGENTLLHDLGCVTLAWTEAGGIVTNARGVPANPLLHLTRTPYGIAVQERFLIAPSTDYARTLAARLDKASASTSS